MMKGRLLAVCSLAVVMLAAGSVAAKAVSLDFGTLAVELEGTVSPEALSADHDQPISFQVGAGLEETAGRTLPTLQRFVLDADRQGHLFTQGLPVCSAARLQDTDTAEALKACKPALVGRGTTSAELHFPSQRPYVVHAPLLMFYGGSPGGKVLLIMQVFAKQPVPTTFVVRGLVGHGSGPYGTHTVVDLPTIAGGNGSLKSFSVKIHRTWSFRGKRRSFLVAHCQTGRFIGHGELDFNDGERIEGTILKRCDSLR